MLIKYNETGEIITSWNYHEENKLFEFFTSTKEKIAEYFPILDLDAEYNPKNFKLVILYNKREDCTENSIYQVYIKKQRIGWIFPVQALLSKDHNFVENTFFLKYAYIATCLLLDQIEEKEKKIFSGDFFLEDFYDSSDNILVMDNENCHKIQNFDLDHYVVSLYKNGYSFTGQGNLYSEIDLVDKTIKLVAQSKELDDIPYIVELFKKQIPREREEFAMFYTYYQIIEILISVVFEVKFKKVLLDLSEDADSLFDKRDELNDIVSEKNRVRWLFSNYVSIRTDIRNELNSACIELLHCCGKKTSEKIAENLYQVRCLLVHKLYILTDAKKMLLKKLNDLFLDALIDIIISFDTSKELIAKKISYENELSNQT
ncbi:MAG: hypothetical protein HFI92_00345 [Lachnospiraceae bacterium]|nr:hypothetical protein [Lachnospiraceae bacterium]